MNFLCEKCGNNFSTNKFTKITSRLADASVDSYYSARCSNCKSEVKSYDLIKYSSPTSPAAYDKPRKKCPDTGQLIVGRERWDNVPYDLYQKLEEERRLREEREHEQGAKEAFDSEQVGGREGLD
jgi:predicted nucleic-acid-binding Zn-ribbon protein